MTELITVSFSELDTYRQCPLKHKLAYEDRWVSATPDNSALGKGSMWHEVMEVHYNTVRDHQTKARVGNAVVWDCTKNELRQHCVNVVGMYIAKLEAAERDPEIVDLIKWMYVGYIEMWDVDEQWDIVSVENTVLAPLMEDDGTPSPFQLKVKLDLLVRDERGRHWLIDHKSCGNLPSNVDLDWSEQFKLYVWALRNVGIRVTGAIHNAARTTRNKGDILKPGDEGYKSTMRAQSLTDRFSRTFMDHTDAQLAGVASDALATFKQAYSEHNHRRRYADPERCKWKCSYKEACLFGRRTGRDSDMIDMLQRTGFEQDYTRH